MQSSTANKQNGKHQFLMHLDAMRVASVWVCVWCGGGGIIIFVIVPIVCDGGVVGFFLVLELLMLSLLLLLSLLAFSTGGGSLVVVAVDVVVFCCWSSFNVVAAVVAAAADSAAGAGHATGAVERIAIWLFSVRAYSVVAALVAVVLLLPVSLEALYKYNKPY
jgi:hypothetical protein